MCKSDSWVFEGVEDSGTPHNCYHHPDAACFDCTLHPSEQGPPKLHRRGCKVRQNAGRDQADRDATIWRSSCYCAKIDSCHANYEGVGATTRAQVVEWVKEIWSDRWVDWSKPRTDRGEGSITYTKIDYQATKIDYKDTKIDCQDTKIENI